MTLLRQEGWTRWPTEVPSNPEHSVILWFCEVGLCASSWSGVEVLGGLPAQVLATGRPGIQGGYWVNCLSKAECLSITGVLLCLGVGAGVRARKAEFWEDRSCVSSGVYWVPQSSCGDIDSVPIWQGAACVCVRVVGWCGWGRRVCTSSRSGAGPQGSHSQVPETGDPRAGTAHTECLGQGLGDLFCVCICAYVYTHTHAILTDTLLISQKRTG